MWLALPFMRASKKGRTPNEESCPDLYALNNITYQLYQYV